MNPDSLVAFQNKISIVFWQLPDGDILPVKAITDRCSRTIKSQTKETNRRVAAEARTPRQYSKRKQIESHRSTPFATSNQLSNTNNPNKASNPSRERSESSREFRRGEIEAPPPLPIRRSRWPSPPPPGEWTSPSAGSASTHRRRSFSGRRGSVFSARSEGGLPSAVGKRTEGRGEGADAGGRGEKRSQGEPRLKWQPPEWGAAGKGERGYYRTVRRCQLAFRNLPRFSGAQKKISGRSRFSMGGRRQRER